MKKIFLNRGQVATVDSLDYEWLNQWKWRAQKNGHTCYAVRQLYTKQDRGKCFFMHREIMGLIHGDKRQVDHINGNGLDNRKINLRICSKQQNHWNQRPLTGYSSKYKGVYWDKTHKKWGVLIYCNNKPKRLGYYDDEIEAAMTYDLKAQRLFGDFAKVNFKRILCN